MFRESFSDESCEHKSSDVSARLAPNLRGDPSRVQVGDEGAEDGRSKSSMLALQPPSHAFVLTNSEISLVGEMHIMLGEVLVIEITRCEPSCGRENRRTNPTAEDL